MTTHVYRSTPESVPYQRLAGAVIIQACADACNGDMYRSREHFQTAAEALFFLTDEEGPWAEARDLWATAARRDPLALLEYGQRATRPYAQLVRAHVAALGALDPFRDALRAAQRAVSDEKTAWADYRRTAAAAREPVWDAILRLRGNATDDARMTRRELRAQLHAIGAAYRIAMAEHQAKATDLREALAHSRAALHSEENAAWGVYLDAAKGFPTPTVLPETVP